MRRNLTTSVVVAAIAVSILVAAPSSATTFPDEGAPIAAEAYFADLVEANHENGKLPAESLVELESSPGCLLEKEAAEAWLRLEEHALRDGIELTAAWCYRNIRSQWRTYRRNCPLPVDPGAEQSPADPEQAQAGSVSDDATAAANPTTDETASHRETTDELGQRVCRIPTAKPGNSNHGWGRAVDLTQDDRLLGCASEAFAWLTQNASRYGWVHPEWAACGSDKEEAWHWEWGGTVLTKITPPHSKRLIRAI